MIIGQYEKKSNLAVKLDFQAFHEKLEGLNKKKEKVI